MGVALALQLIEGNLLDSDCDIIVHQVNCQGVMGSGIAKQIRVKWPNVYNSYTRLCDDYINNRQALLGQVLFCATDTNIVANIFSQLYYGNGVQTDYAMLLHCLQIVADYANECAYTVALPYKLGGGLGGGDWKLVHEIIEDVFKYTDGEIRKLEGYTEVRYR